MKIWAPLFTSGHRAHKAYFPNACDFQVYVVRRPGNKNAENKVANRFREASCTRYHYNSRQRREPATRRSSFEMGFPRNRAGKANASVLHKRNLDGLARDRLPVLTRALNSDSCLLTERRSPCFLRNIIRLPAVRAGRPLPPLIRGGGGGPAPSVLTLCARVRRSLKKRHVALSFIGFWGYLVSGEPSTASIGEDSIHINKHWRRRRRFVVKEAKEAYGRIPSYSFASPGTKWGEDSASAGFPEIAP